MYRCDRADLCGEPCSMGVASDTPFTSFVCQGEMQRVHAIDYDGPILYFNYVTERWKPKDSFAVNYTDPLHTCYYCEHEGTDVNRIAKMWGCPGEEETCFCCDDAVACDHRWQ
ncbi:hypothetical protein LCGC14_3148480, partial [marine sediment metagenome]